MVGHLWSKGVAIDPGRLIDDSDTAYYLTVVASYRRLLEIDHAESERRRASQPT